MVVSRQNKQIPESEVVINKFDSHAKNLQLLSIPKLFQSVASLLQ